MTARVGRGPVDEREPTSAELAAIEREWPDIAWDLFWVTAEIVSIMAEDAPWDRSRLDAEIAILTGDGTGVAS